jgi:farnesyl-diphosphate farnesyltransferase
LELDAGLGKGLAEAVERIDREVLKRVSRSFYLSLRLLPGPMRGPVSLGYLLARASDTLADTESVPVADRIALLDGFSAEVAGGSDAWRAGGLNDFISRQTHDGERELLARLPECFQALQQSPAGELAALRDVVATITAGQRLDLLRFAGATKEQPVSLADDGELEDYCYRVAGCVGAFWTRVGFLTLGKRFSDADSAVLEEAGIRYGRGLQLVNILRDFPEDLANGRCYLPGNDLAAAHRHWLGVAKEWLGSGKYYASRLKSRRLRIASVTPALLGMDTLELLEAHGSPPQSKIKVSRAAVRRALWEAFWWPTSGQ